MGTSIVRLDDKAEEGLDNLRRLSGRSISEVLKRRLRVDERQALEDDADRRP